MLTVKVQLEGSIQDVRQGLKKSLAELGEPSALVEVEAIKSRLYELILAVREGRRIAAIKAVRDLHNLGLKDAKELVEAAWAGGIAPTLGDVNTHKGGDPAYR